MRIGYIVYNYNSLSELWLQRQIEMLEKEIVFIAAIDSKEKFWRNTIPVFNLSRYSFVKKILEKLKIFKKKPLKTRYNENLSKVLSFVKIDVIFVNYLSFAYDLKSVLQKTNLPIIIHTHGYDITWDLISRENGRRIYDEAYFNFAKEICEKAIFIANSNFSKSKILEIGVPADKVVVKNFGVPIEDKKEFNQSTKDIKILYLGRLIEFKAPDLVIKAFEIACDKGLDGELLIAGGGNLENTCKSLRDHSKYKNKITLIGPVSAEKGVKLRSMCDIFTAHNCKSATTNQVEAFGVSIIEAMSAGLPVVTGRSGGVVETVIDGVTGFLFTPGDSHAHAEKLLELSLNPDLRKEMGKNAINRVRRNFSLEGEKSFLLELLRNEYQKNCNLLARNNPATKGQIMKNSIPTISVVIPAFNAEKTIENSILSVLNQKKLPEEIIIVDDGSTDGTVNVVNKYRNQVKLICQRNQGAAVARQTGTELSKSQYIAYLDSDDWWPDNKISRIRKILSSEHIDFLLSDLERAYPGGATENNLPKNSFFFPWVRQCFIGNEVGVHQQNLFKLDPEIALQVLLRGFPVFPSTMVVRRSVVEKIDGWDYRFKRCQDFDIGLRIAKRYPLHYLDEVLAILGLHEGNDNEYLYITKQYEGDVKVLRAHLQVTSSGSKHYRQIAEAIGRKYRVLGYAHKKKKQYKMARINYAKALLWPGYRAHSLIRYLYCIRQ